MLTDMTRTTLISRMVCLSVITTLFFGYIPPVWAQDEEEVGGTEYKDPSIVTEESTSAPDGVKDLAKKFEKKPITDPVYNKWWFWAAAIGVAGAWIAFAVIPLQKKAPTCGTEYGLGCIGDGR
jgi:hypothetical protein